MSVVIVARFSVPDVAGAIEALATHAPLLEEITEDAKGLGCLHHRFLAGDGDLIVLDEWGTADQFENFFEANVSSAHERDGGTTGEAHSAWRAG